MRMRFIPAGLALTAVLAASQAPMVLTRSFWSGPQPESPHLPVEGSSLDFVLRPATAAEGPTLALLAAARLPGPIAETYGARAEGATQIVAVDSATGAVFSRPAEREGSAPLSAIGSRPKASQAGGATVDSIEVWFNADLRSHLDLPPEAKTYSVFLWLDEMTSPLHLADLPASGQPSTPSAPAGYDVRNSFPKEQPFAQVAAARTGACASVITPPPPSTVCVDLCGISVPRLDRDGAWL